MEPRSLGPGGRASAPDRPGAGSLDREVRGAGLGRGPNAVGPPQQAGNNEALHRRDETAGRPLDNKVPDAEIRLKFINVLVTFVAAAVPPQHQDQNQGGKGLDSPQPSLYLHRQQA